MKVSGNGHIAGHGQHRFEDRTHQRWIGIPDGVAHHDFIGSSVKQLLGTENHLGERDPPFIGAAQSSGQTRTDQGALILRQAFDQVDNGLEVGHRRISLPAYIFKVVGLADRDHVVEFFHPKLQAPLSAFEIGNQGADHQILELQGPRTNLGGIGKLRNQLGRNKGGDLDL